ncbi:cytosolic carboxypeptidase 3 isoform X2 [Bos mutus]|uniref:cytosolic carboxypeptidase 3 isoform X2 n=1 Tax=Bos mutus TaxID=72004 RepID=UPI0038B4868C
MSEDSEKEDYSDRTISDEDESDEDNFMKFVNEDIHQCALLTDWTPSNPEPMYIPTGLEMEPLYANSKEETVVYLAEDGNKRGTHFNTKDLESMGYHFCDSLLDYCDPDRTKYYQCLKELDEMEKHINLEKVIDDSDTSLKEITLDLETSSHASDSSESNDSQTDLLKLNSQIKTKKKQLKTKKERNSTIERHQNIREEEQEVCDKGHLVQRHKESDSDVTDTRPSISDDCIFDYFRRQLPNQGL